MSSLPDCPDEDSWLAFLAREGPTSELDGHLAGCSTCRALVGLLAKEEPSVRASNVAALDAVDDGGSSREGAVGELGEATGPSREAVDPRIGTVVADKWSIEALLGAGGMGRVYRARHRNGHRVAIKFLHSELAAREEVVRRFRREGYSANRVEHPAIVRVLDDGDDGGPFLVMELLEGSSCRATVRDDGPRSPDEALRIVEAVGEALAAAHRVGVVHRDVKPDNVFLLPDGGVRLLDFGLAAVRDPIAQDSITADGTTVGTVGYMPPEQARGENSAVGPSSDVWSLAATCVSLVAGHPVHRGRTPAEQLAFAVTKKVPPVRSFRLGFSRAVEAVLDRALSFDPADRPVDAGAFVAELTRARAQREPSSRPWFAVVGVAVAGGVAMLGVTLAGTHDASPSSVPSESSTSTSSASPVTSAAPSSPSSSSSERASTEVVRQDVAPSKAPSNAPPRRTERRTPSPPPESVRPDAAVNASPSAALPMDRDPLLPRF